jgi:predicted MFS family arabinose efflux permease
MSALLKWFWPDQKATKSEWQLILLLGTAFLVSRYDFTLLSLALPDIQRDLNIAERDLGQFIAFARLGAIAALPLAVMADRMGRRRLLIATIIGCTLCSVGTAFATNWQMFSVLQFASRAFTAADEIISVVVILEEVAIRRRGWAVGMIAAAGGLGDGLAAALNPLSKILPGEWRALYLIAVVPLVIIVFLRRGLKETDRFMAIAQKREDGWGTIWAGLAAHPKKLGALLLVSVIYHIPISAALSLMSKFLQESHDYSRGQVSILFIVAGAIALICNLVGGSLTDRIGRRAGFTVACFMMVVGFGVFYLAPTSIVPFAWCFALFAFLASHSIFLAISGEAFPTISRTTVAALMLAIGSVATAFGLVAEGWLFERLESHALAVVSLLPAFILAGLSALALLRETAGTELQDQFATGD